MTNAERILRALDERLDSPMELRLYRLADLDLLLSKLMRDDPLDQQDALFIAARSGLSREQIECGLRAARVPAAAELREQFRLASQRRLQRLSPGAG